MKKILAIVLCAALMLVLAIPAMAVVNLNPNNSAINVDGVRDEAYAGSIAVAVHHQNADATNSMESATGNVWAAWDAANLYFYIEVDDKTPNHQQANEDNVEFMIDWNSGKGGADFATPETPYWQVRCFANTPNLDGVNLNGLIMNAEGIDWSINYSEIFEGVCKWFSGPLNGDYKNGYIIELAIAAPEGVTLSEGKTIPFEIQICDNITGADLREGQVFLEASETNDSQWHDPSTCNGLLTLGGAYVAPVAAAEAVSVEAAQGGGEAADAEVAPVVQAATAPQTGDSAMIFVVLAVALIGAIVVSKCVSKSRV